MQILPISAAAGLARLASSSLQNLLGTPARLATAGNAKTQTDSVSLSPQAIAAAKAKAADQTAQARAETFATELRSALSAAGIELSESLTLKSDAEGRVTIEGTHADQEQIESILERDTGLATQFNLLARDMAVAAGNPNGWNTFRMTVNAASWSGSFATGTTQA